MHPKINCLWKLLTLRFILYFENTIFPIPEFIAQLDQAPVTLTYESNAWLQTKSNAWLQTDCDND